MKQQKKVIISIICLCVVLIVIIASFVYKYEIEKYSTTGYFGMFIACIASTSTILLPAPGIFVVIQYAQLLNPFIVILLGGLGTSIGEIFGYILGMTGKEITNVKTDNKLFVFFNKHNNLAVFMFSLLPLPIFDIIGICAGMTKMNPIKFWVLCFFGKTLKMTAYVMLFFYTKDLMLNIYRY